MKIAMIGQKGMPAHYGGVERHVHDLSVRLVEIGHEVIAYSRKWYPEILKKDVNGVNIAFTPSLHTKHLDAITHTFTSTIHALFQDYDVIHYHGVGPSLLSWIPRILKPRAKIIITFHSIDRYHQKWNMIAKFFLRLGERAACTFAHETITVSQSLQKYCVNEFGKDTAYIPNGVYIPEYEIGNNLIDKFGLEKDNYLVMVSRLVPHKGAHLLIEAFHNLKAHNADDPKIKNLKLAIVGGEVYTNEYVKQLHLQASNVNDIVFTDFQSGDMLEQLYKNALTLVHPSLNEGLPITVLQAMSYNKPVLVSTIPEHLELINNPRALFYENDVDSIERCMDEFLNTSAEQRSAMGKKNLETIEEEYAWNIIAPQVEKVYAVPTKRQAKRTARLSQLPV
ncbi:glycosyltransferase family 4 protein [Candidatus Parcubacteria bacterium]|jgi:glycosyltransferase involved in cell wall biosynthesis|nr:glycosyltransferase family 4 protein [Candidatus Parcubacteria bacterium]MBT3949433.1 glycosyltransferase family 4 protein [Candidatus Parcubacteria bacterium]